MLKFIKRSMKSVIQTITSGSNKTAEISKDLLEKYKLVRRIILAVLLIWLSILLKVLISIVTNSETHDIGPNFANVLIAYFTFAGAFFSFYTMNRTSEIKDKEYANSRRYYNDQKFEHSIDGENWEDIK